jgi:hypothetical protein
MDHIGELQPEEILDFSNRKRSIDIDLLSEQYIKQ